MLPEILRFKRFSGLLWLVLLLGQCFISVNADVVVESLTQSPANPVVAGSVVTYSVTVSNPDAATFISIAIVSNQSNVSALFENREWLGSSPEN